MTRSRTPWRSAVGRRLLDLGGSVALYAVLVWAPLAAGAYRGWPLAATQLVLLSGLVLWVLRMAASGRLEWRRTALDLPLVLLVGVVLAQLALGNGPLVAWALAPAPGEPLAPVALPTLFLLGTVSPAQTARSFRLYLTYASVYVLVVNVIRTRRALNRLIGTLLVLGDRPVLCRAPRLSRRTRRVPRRRRARRAASAVGYLCQPGPLRRVARDADLPRRRLCTGPITPIRSGYRSGLATRLPRGARALFPPLHARDRGCRDGPRADVHAEPRRYRQHSHRPRRAPGPRGRPGPGASEPGGGGQRAGGDGGL